MIEVNLLHNKLRDGYRPWCIIMLQRSKTYMLLELHQGDPKRKPAYALRKVKQIHYLVDNQ